MVNRIVAGWSRLRGYLHQIDGRRQAAGASRDGKAFLP
jgi:hypothetical protein